MRSSSIVKAEAGPVAGAAKLFDLAEDLCFALFFPVPDMLEKFFAGKSLRLLPWDQVAFDDRLRGDASMVGPGHPEGLKAAHPFPADQDVLQGVDQGVAHVQDACDIGRGDEME